MAHPEDVSLLSSDLSIPDCIDTYRGKVRDIYDLGDRILMVATDRISAFDHILPRPIPYKGIVLQQMARHFLTASARIVPNWLDASADIDPAVAIGRKARPYKVEMVIRGYLAGHAWREYRKGRRELCGRSLPEGLQEGDALPQPIITPSTKATEGHDEDIRREAIIEQGIVDRSTYRQIEEYTYQLFELGQTMARDRGLILVDTKYEFGKAPDGNPILIDEIHTPDSSRYYLLEGYRERQQRGERQTQLSKEFVREWLMDLGFQGKEGQTMPEMPDELVWEISQNYRDLYQQITGRSFEVPDSETPPNDRIQQALNQYFQ